MADTGTSEWQQIRVNLPQDFYAILRERSARHGTSMSAEAFRLMKLGLANVKPTENIAADLTALKRYMELHFEPLVFIAAMDAATSREFWRYQLYSAHPEQMEAVARKLDERATKRIRRKLHQLPDPPEEPKEGESDDEDGGT